MPRAKRKEVQNDAIKLLSEICKKARRYQGLTIEQMAEYTQYSVEAIKQFERGASNNMLMFVIYMNRCTYFNWDTVIKLKRI